MTTKPILFSGEMVRAILEGRKTQTRRVVKGIRIRPEIHNGTMWATKNEDGWSPVLEFCPYGKVGDLLWVRETWAALRPSTDMALDSVKPQPGICTLAYRATEERGIVGKWRPSIFMPRWASRITLEIVSVKVERVQDITDDDAIEEGVDRTNTSIPTYARQRYQKLWDSINGKRPGCSWADNPWVWVIEFRRTT